MKINEIPTPFYIVYENRLRRNLELINRVKREAGVNIKAMQDILGHKDAETTLQIYTDATRDLKKREMRNLADYFKDGA